MSANTTGAPAAAPDGGDGQGDAAPVEAAIASFILRFTQEHPDDDGTSEEGWRGVIRHVQSRQQTGFTRMEDALSFISRYVSIGKEGGRE
jgi:hypothetical protein